MARTLTERPVPAQAMSGAPFGPPPGAPAASPVAEPNVVAQAAASVPSPAGPVAQPAPAIPPQEPAVVFDAPSSASAATPERQAPTYRVLLEFSDGSQVMLDDDAVLGRKPEQAAVQDDLIAVPLVDPLKSASRVHLRLFMTPQGVNVVDADSGNGTRVEHEGTMYECTAGQPFWIEPGDRLWLGEVPIAVSLG
ncbi:FHA domain-containing protein [Galactobacter caseinivorans]|uniref:FHA domain-containing protein n=1 Tax=Galactobacter caseinivorans TaxID=2676123 RepID=UPI0011C3902F|nr:FHA domain-containing protein [Galactobacter caseinivorans]